MAANHPRPDLAHAVALAYHEGDGAPRVRAKGSGPIAAEIIRRAREAGVYVHESRELVGLLMQVDLDQHIPPKLYAAIAELLAWLYRLEHNRQCATPSLPPAAARVLLPQPKQP
ncbi:MAG TPA: EscU/YscU/HrcU family type III secretion system export apparatus switch protein [Burkholderiales bacterium]|jgi:flagellar biosynthesis protein